MVDIIPFISPTAQAPVATLAIASITVSPGCQLRNAGSPATVANYAEMMKSGDTFPPIVVFHDGETYWLADGFHRLEAAQAAGLAEIAVEMHAGGERDAMLHAAGANATHGLPRTQADRQKAIAVLLADPEWRVLSDREIARHVHVDGKTVAKARRALSGIGGAEFRTAGQQEVVPQIAGQPGSVPQQSTEGAEFRSVPQSPDGAAEHLTMSQTIIRSVPTYALVAELRRRGLVVEGS